MHRNWLNLLEMELEQSWPMVGVRTVTTWTQRARRDLGYSLMQGGNPQPNPHIDVFPSLDYNSAHYTFLGQPYRITEDRFQ